MRPAARTDRRIRPAPLGIPEVNLAVAVDRDHVRSPLARLAAELDDRVVGEVTGDVVRQPVLAAQAFAVAFVVRQVVPPRRRFADPKANVRGEISILFVA